MYQAKAQLATDVCHHLLDLEFLFACEREEWQARKAAEVAVQVHGVLHAGNTEFANHARGGFGDPFLLLLGERVVAFSPGSVDLIASGRGGASEGEDGSNCSGIERWRELLCGSDQDLETDFLLTGFNSINN